ncbi:E1 ubiquitin-activating enzyme [Balamuthia mandrillaris]
MQQLRLAKEETDAEGVDTDLMSRVLPIMGAGNLKKLMSLHVLVSGMSGLGAEIAKNLILCGCGSVTIHDTQPAQWVDLASQFYLTEADVGKNRAEACLARLAELNPYTKTKAHTGALEEGFLDQFKVVVLVDYNSQEELLRVSDYCHSKGIVFIKTDCRGLFSCVFCDFGEEHLVQDATGEEAKQAIITSISQANPAVVTTHEEKPHGLHEGDYVQFSEVEGMTEINFTGAVTHPTAAIKVTKINGLYGFEVDIDTTNFKPYAANGLVNEVKIEIPVKSKSYRDALEVPGEFIISDFAKFGRAEQLHFGFQALLAFQAQHDGALPEPGNAEHAAEIVKLATELNNAAKEKKDVHTVEEIDADIISKLAITARGSVNPLTAFAGGVVAQEVLKVTGKFNPIHQWFYFDSLECLPPEDEAHQVDRTLKGTRYDGQIAIFGNDFQHKLMNLKTFLVGAGALGCEFLKNFACMGVSCGEQGKLTLTDMDNIEKSNLSRQLLYRDRDIGKMKSVCAKRAACEMNSQFNIEVHEIPVGPDTEDTFNDQFWQELDLVINALDNIKARLYVDGQCVRYQKPLLESGTLGTKANTQVVLPRKTESYGSSRDPPDAAIPMCTLKNFPHQIEHTIEWARDKFAGYFTNAFEDANNWVSGDDFVKSLEAMESAAAKKERLQSAVTFLDMFQGGQVTFEDCVRWARLQFQDLFYNIIEQLLFNFPKNAVTSTGAPFWSGPKRAPTSIQFCEEDETHIQFVVAAANLLAYCFRVEDPRSKDVEFVKKVVSTVEVPPFVPKQGIKIKSGDDDKTPEGSEDDEEIVANLLARLEALPKNKFPVAEDGRCFNPISFEKDDDTNFHVAFMTHASNLRAANYHIPPADFHKTKKIAGRITPAIATTTAMITGLVGLELYKTILLLHDKEDKFPLEKFRNSFVNLAVPTFVQSEPLPCAVHKSDPAKKKRYYPEGWTLWDSFVVDEGDVTFKQLLQIFEEKHKLVISSISCGTSLIYNPFFPAHKARMDTKISEYVKNHVTSYQIKPTDKHIQLVVLVEDVDDDELEVEIPDPLLLKFRE